MAVIQLTGSEINFFITGTEDKFSVTKQQILADKNFLHTAGKKRAAKQQLLFVLMEVGHQETQFHFSLKIPTEQKVRCLLTNVSNCWSESLSLKNKVSNENDSHVPLARYEILISRCNFKPWLSNFQKLVTKMIPGELHIHSLRLVKLN